MKSNIVKYILQNPKYNDHLKCDPEVKESIDSCCDLLYIKDDDYVKIFAKFIKNGGFAKENFQLPEHNFASIKQNKTNRACVWVTVMILVNC